MTNTYLRHLNAAKMYLRAWAIPYRTYPIKNGTVLIARTQLSDATWTAIANLACDYNTTDKFMFYRD